MSSEQPTPAEVSRQLEEARAEIERLREDVEPYLEHKSRCKVYQDLQTCDCGFFEMYARFVNNEPSEKGGEG